MEKNGHERSETDLSIRFKWSEIEFRVVVKGWKRWLELGGPQVKDWTRSVLTLKMTDDSLDLSSMSVIASLLHILEIRRSYNISSKYLSIVPFFIFSLNQPLALFYTLTTQKLSNFPKKIYKYILKLT